MRENLFDFFSPSNLLNEVEEIKIAKSCIEISGIVFIY